MPIYQSLYYAILKFVNKYNMINLLHNFYCLSILFIKLNTNNYNFFTTKLWKYFFFDKSIVECEEIWTLDVTVETPWITN